MSDFYIGFPKNDPDNLQLFVTTREPDSVTFIVETLLGFQDTCVATHDSTTAVTLPINFQVENSDQRNKGIHVSAQRDKQINVYGFSHHTLRTDAFLALPCLQLPVDQYEYYAISYTAAAENSQLLFVGCEDNTVVQFGTTTITLNQMETYYEEFNPDVTGLRVVSNKPISLFSGDECTKIPAGGFCDHLLEQLPPTATWGTTFLSASFESRMTGEIYRILASQPSTSVSVNCNTYSQPRTYSLATAGAWQEFMTPDDSFCVIESNKPLLVVEFALGRTTDIYFNRTGDPFMMMIPPVEQYSNNYVFNAPSEYTTNFITIFVTPEYFEPDKIFVDDISQEQTVWTTIHCQDGTVCGYAAYASMETGDHRLYHSDPVAKIGAAVYGFNIGVSYGYAGGLQPVAMKCKCNSIEYFYVQVVHCEMTLLILTYSGCFELLERNICCWREQWDTDCASCTVWKY